MHCIDKLLEKTNRNKVKLIKNIIGHRKTNTHSHTHNVIRNEDPESSDSSVEGHILAKPGIEFSVQGSG